MIQKVLVTGSTGFIGANLVRRLLKENYDVHAFIRPKSQNIWRVKEILGSLNMHSLDVLDNNTVRNTVNKIKPDVIFHLATYGAYPYETDLKRIININVLATVNLLQTCCKIGFRSFINIGSSSEYGIKGKAIKETDTLEPLTTYGAAKASASIICTQFAHQYNLNIATLRPFSAYGPFEEKNRLIPTLMKAAITGKKANLSSKNFVRDFIYVEDVIDAFIKATKRKASGIYNIGSGKEYTIGTVVDLVKKIKDSNLKVDWQKSKPRAHEPKHWRANISLASKELSWAPKTNLARGLLATYRWFEKNIHFYQ